MMKYQQDKVIAYDFLCTQGHATVVTINSEGKADASAIFFFIEPDFSCFFVTKVNTRKYTNLKEKNVCTLFAYNPETLVSVEMKGSVDLSNDIKKTIRTITQFQQLVLNRKTDYWVPPIAQIEAGEYVVCKFEPEKLTYNDFSQSQDKKTITHEIIFN